MKTIQTVLMTIALFILAAVAYAGNGDNDHNRNKHRTKLDTGGVVLPADAEPKGYSLVDMVKATAVFNVTDHSGLVPDVINSKPFKGLFTKPDCVLIPPTSGVLTCKFHINEDTMLYVPVLFNDDSLPVIGDYPDVGGNRSVLEKYFMGHKDFGINYTTISVDGKVTSLNHDYLVEAEFNQPLSDGATQYMTVAAFLSPLKKGKHIVEISALADGIKLCQVMEDLGSTCPWGFSIRYLVTVD